MERKRKAKETNDSDDEIWGYTSVKRVKKNLHNPKPPKTSIIAHRTSAVSQKKTGLVSTLAKHGKCPNKVGLDPKNEKKTKVTSISSYSNETSTTNVDCAIGPNNNSVNKKRGSTPPKEPANMKPKHKGTCPFCQMPFAVLTIESPRWHVTECMDLPLNATQECPCGVKCDSTIPSHFRKFRHSLLANVRAGVGGEERKTDDQKSFSRKLTFDSNSKHGAEQASTPASHSKQPPTERIPEIFEDRNRFEDKRKAELTVEEVKKSLFQTPDKDVPKGDEQESDIISCSERMNVEKDESEVQSDQDIFGDEESETGDDKCEDSETESNERCAGAKKGDTEGLVFGICAEIEPASTGTSLANNLDNLMTDTLSFLPGSAGDHNADEDLRPVAVHEISDDDDDGTILAAGTEAESSQANQTQKETMEHSPFSRSGRKPRIRLKNRTGQPRKFQNAGTDSKQSSVLDFFRPAWERTKQAVINAGSMLSLGGNTAQSDDARPSTSTASTVSRNVSKSVKPWPLKPQATSKAGMMSSGSAATNRERGSNRWGREIKQCPFYKKMPGTPFTVDAFRYGSVAGCTAYFLTHFHADHYGGLTKKFKHPIYCSKVTANLVKSKLRVEEKYINTLPMDEPVTVEGITVTLLEANHCPGSVLFLFQLPNGQNILHTGDFRACPEMESYPSLLGTKIHQLYLDTTYCDPAYAFPAQREVIQFAVNLVRDAVYEQPNLLVVTGSYTIGKERIFMAIAEELNSKICVTREKQAVLQCLEDHAMNKRITLQKSQAKVHVLPMQWLNYPKMSEYLQELKPHFDSVLAISPTGWTHSNKTVSLDKIRPKTKSHNVTIYGLPYSEHSSFTEMKKFVQFTRPDKVIATVNNGNPASRKKMDAYFQSWLNDAEESTPSKRARQSTLSDWFASKT